MCTGGEGWVGMHVWYGWGKLVRVRVCGSGGEGVDRGGDNVVRNEIVGSVLVFCMMVRRSVRGSPRLFARRHGGLGVWWCSGCRCPVVALANGMVPYALGSGDGQHYTETTHQCRIAMSNSERSEYPVVPWVPAPEAPDDEWTDVNCGVLLQ